MSALNLHGRLTCGRVSRWKYVLYLFFSFSGAGSIVKSRSGGVSGRGGGQRKLEPMRFALQCYVDESLHEAVKAAAAASHMSMSQWLKLAVIEKVEGNDETAYRDQLMSHMLFATAAAEGLLLAQADKDIRPRVHTAHGKRLNEYRERFARAKRSA